MKCSLTKGKKGWNLSSEMYVIALVSFILLYYLRIMLMKTIINYLIITSKNCEEIKGKDIYNLMLKTKPINCEVISSE